MSTMNFALSPRLGRVLGTTAGLLVGLAGLAPTALADERNADGWTVLRPAPDTRFVFVSSSEGDDRNSGRTPAQAVRTIAKAASLVRNNSADWLLLKKGDTWHEGFGSWKNSGRSEDERVVIASYGDADTRPTIVCEGENGIAAPYGQDVSHVAIVGIHFKADRPASSDSSRGIRWLSVGEDLLVENCKIEGFFNNISIEGINVGFENAQIRRNVIVDAWSVSGHAQGIFANDVTGLLIEENIIDRNGWNPDVPGADATTFKQNVYLQVGVTGVEFRGNITSRASAAGVQMRSGGIAEDNLIYANPMGLRFGYSSLEWPQEAARGVIRNNVVVGGPLSRDVDEVFGIWTERMLDTQITGNVVTKAQGSNALPIAYTMGGNAANVVMHNNTAYKWTNGSLGQAIKFSVDTVGTEPGSVTVRDNRWIMPGSDKVVNIRTMGMIAFWSNDFEGVDGSDEIFKIDGQNATMSEWLATPNVTQDQILDIHLVDESRDLKAYAQHLGFTDEVAFLQAARSMSRDNWDVRLTGAAASAWIRAGFETAGN